MKISFEKKILAGYIINMVVMFLLGIILWNIIPLTTTPIWLWVSMGLIMLSLGMLTTVFFILRSQLRAKRISEQALLKNEKLLQSIIDNTNSAISVKKINGEYLFVNKEFQSLFPINGKNIVGSTNHEFLPTEVADRYRNADLEVIKVAKEIQIEENFDLPSGPHTYLSVKFPLFDPENRIYAIGNISTDITERKSGIDSLKAADTFFNLSLDSMVIATNEKFIKVNPALGKLLGYSTAELLNKPFAAFIYPEDLERTQKELEKLAKGTELINFQNRWLCKDGTLKWLSWNATADMATGNLFAIVRDITEALQQEEEEEKLMSDLYESQQKLNLILENISDGVLVANNEKEVILANEVANRLFGIEEDSQISINFSDHFKVLYPQGNKTFPAQELPAARAFKGEITDDVDVLLKNLMTDELHRVLLSGRPIVDTENKVVAAVVTIKDISEYKKLEEDMEKRDQEARPLIGFKPRKGK